MGQINVEVKVMKCKNPILFTWWNKEEVCVDACLVTCQCQGYKLDHCQQLITTEEQQTMPSSTIHALGDMKWAEKFAKALEASELITIPNRELDVVLSDAPDEEPEADTPPKQVKRNRKKQEEIKRGVKDLCLDKIIFDKTKSHVNNAAQVILEEFMTHQIGEDDEADKSQKSESLARRGRSGNTMEKTAENSREEDPGHQGHMKETSAKCKSAIVVRPESRQSNLDENLVLESSCIEESARICGLKEPDEGPGVLKISNVGQAHDHSPLSPRTFAELQPMRSSLNTMHHANQPMKDIHSIQLTDRKIDDSLNIGGHSVDDSMQALSQRNISKSSIPQESALDNGNASIGNDGNISIAGMTFTTLEPSASSLFRSEIFPSEQHQTTICANPVDVSVGSHMSFISSSDINLSDVSQATIPLTYTPHGQLSFEDQTIFDTLRGMIDSAAPKSNLNTVTMETGITGEQHTPNETPSHAIPHDRSKSLSSAMSNYLAHKDDEYKRKYQKYQNDPNSVFVLCECCGAALTNKSIKRHMESIHSKGDRVRAHQCDVCGKKFLYETNLKRHLFIHTGVRFKCSFCDKTYKQDWNRQVHEKTHLNPGPSATAVRKPLRRNAHLSNRSVDCKICGKTLKQQSMKLHMDSHNQKMSTCQICGKTVKSGSKYQHAKLHTNEKTHACSYCSAKFYFKSALVAHMRKHTKERPIPCRYCDRTFPRYEARTNHERIHTGERPYSCDICRKDWRDRPTYMQHMQKHHPGVPLMYKKKPNTQ